MTQHIKTGGPAFPCECTNDGYEETTGFNNDVIPAGTTCQYRGLTIRDYFAAKALESGEAGQWKDNQYKPQDGKTIIENISLHAYQIADAMLRAREQQ